MQNNHLINLKNTLATYTEKELSYMQRNDITDLLTKTMHLCEYTKCNFCYNLKANTCKDNIPF